MNIVVVGTGYVGLVTGTCFAEMGVNVHCVDVNQSKIELLRKGVIPIYEPGLDSMVNRCVAEGRLKFGTSLSEAVKDADVIFSAVGTPPDEDGSADLSYVLSVAKEIGQNIEHYVVVVTKSTVPVGTSVKVKKTIQSELDKRGVNVEFDIASNPEFLKEGSAVKDFMSPDRVVVGIESERAREIMSRLYRPFLLNNFRVMFTDIASAEMIKYAANAMLATRISFMNDIANLCELVGADVSEVRRGIGSDTRIGNKFLYPGCGYGGSCFPKDVKALVRVAEEKGYRMRVLDAVEEVNSIQKHVPFYKLASYFDGDLSGKAVAIWGLSFKAETDDMREATSLVVIDDLLKAGCNIKVYDPVAKDECKRRIGDRVSYSNDMYDCVEGSDALIVLTEWKQFRLPVWNKVRQKMNGDKPLVIDGRNIYQPEEVEQSGLVYTGIGRGRKLQ